MEPIREEDTADEVHLALFREAFNHIRTAHDFIRLCAFARELRDEQEEETEE